MHGTAWTDESTAKTYLEGVRGAIPLAGEQIEVMLRVLEAGRPVEAFLDLGCGDGVLAEEILRRRPGARAIAVDVSAPMLEAARQRLAAWGDRVEFTELDYGEAEWSKRFGSSRLDAVISGYSIHHQPDPAKREIYGEIHRLLEPGGAFINIEHVASATPRVEKLFEELLVDSLHAYHLSQDASATRAEVAARYYDRPDKSENILAPVERQCEWLREIGFEDVDCFFKIFELAVFGGRKASEATAL